MLMNFSLNFFTQKRKLKFEQIFFLFYIITDSHPIRLADEKFISTILTHLTMHCWSKLWIANSFLSWILLVLKQSSKKLLPFWLFFCYKTLCCIRVWLLMKTFYFLFCGFTRFFFLIFVGGFPLTKGRKIIFSAWKMLKAVFLVCRFATRRGRNLEIFWCLKIFFSLVKQWIKEISLSIKAKKNILATFL